MPPYIPLMPGNTKHIPFKKEAFAMHKEEKVLQGICCEVANCVHNNGHCCCTAKSKNVKNRMAVLGEETMCETYEQA